ncbi:MAG TPA: polysaccharide biosynthesis/export family protein [Methylomirabilota bacterium]|jgi:polysaccharide export outer membrane protein|nr:polysaccharide biosynthesis/export family protein [Methylomirabilota bacterium]
MTLKWFVVAAALLAGFGVFTAHAQMRPQPAYPPAKSSAPAAPQASAPMPAASPSSSFTTGAAAPMGGFPVSSDYVIGPEDVLQISVWKNEALSRTLAVRPDGKISIPLLHDVQAAGLTPMQLRDKIATALSEFMPNAEVAVTVTDVRSYRVSVLGEVQRPGVLQLKSDTTVLEALALAGGFRDFASPGKIMILRKDAHGSTHKIPFNYHRAVKDTRNQDNVTLKSGDVVVVP